jgi:hypothetical protein
MARFRRARGNGLPNPPLPPRLLLAPGPRVWILSPHPPCISGPVGAPTFTKLPFADSLCAFGHNSSPDGW